MFRAAFWMESLGRLVGSIPGVVRGELGSVPMANRGRLVASKWPETAVPPKSIAPASPSSNPLREFFERRTHGPGIFKWEHYFDIYHRHLGKFVGRDVHILEIGVYSGGSLEMWRDYFGPHAQVYGVDIQEECRTYSRDGIKIFIGDQADRRFWQQFRQAAPQLDIVIDDGGHREHQQIVTMEELLPHLRPGGVFLCEDLVGARNGFTQFAHGMAQELNAYHPAPGAPHVCQTTPFQRSIAGMHFYPLVTVIEKTTEPVAQLSAPRHGTQWQPFLGKTPDERQAA